VGKNGCTANVDLVLDGDIISEHGDVLHTALSVERVSAPQFFQCVGIHRSVHRKLTQRPTELFQPMIELATQACSLTTALLMMTQRCSLAPAPTLAPGPMTTLGPMSAVLEISSLGVSTRSVHEGWTCPNPGQNSRVDLGGLKASSNKCKSHGIVSLARSASTDSCGHASRLTGSTNTLPPYTHLFWTGSVSRGDFCEVRCER
jgi:hypothetical protein